MIMTKGTTVRTKQPIVPINASPFPQPKRKTAETFLEYDYPALVLFEDLNDSRRTRWLVEVKESYLKKNEKDGYEIVRGMQQFSSHFSVNHPAFVGEYFSSALLCAKELSYFYEHGYRRDQGTGHNVTSD
jgi:hypothetical protein